MNFFIGFIARAGAFYLLAKFALMLLATAYDIDHKDHAAIRNEIHWGRPVRSNDRREGTACALFIDTVRRTVRSKLDAIRRG